MRFLSLLSAVFFLVSVAARPAVEDLVRRQDNNGSSSSSSIPSNSTSTTPTESQSSSSSTTNSVTKTASVVSSSSTLLISTVSVPSVTLQSQTSSTTAPTETPDRSPAGFFSNHSATLILGITGGGIVGIIVIVAIWINFRRSWYFPWNKRKKRNDPNRWSTYSFREKPHLPLGRNIVVTTSTEDFAKRGGPSNDGHSESHHGHSEGHGHQFGMNNDIPPIPEIRIESPRSPWASDQRPTDQRPPGLEEYSRWSRATSHVSEASMSVYSQHTQSVYDDARKTGRYAAEERTNTGGPMASTRVTSASSDTSPFRFDLPYETEHDQYSSSAPRKLTPPHLDPSPPTSSHFPTPVNTRLAARDARERSRLAGEGPFGRPLRYLPTSDDPLQAQAPVPSTSPRAGIYFADEHVSHGLDVIAGSADRYRVLSVGGMDDSPARAFARMDMSPVDLGDASPSMLAPPKPPPKGILKSPHYLTTSARLASRGNRI